MAQNETKVTYRAAVNFSALSRALAKFRKDLAETKAAEAAFNSSSVSGADGAAAARGRHRAAVEADAATVKNATASAKENTNETARNTSATETNTSSRKKNSDTTKEVDAANRLFIETLKKTSREYQKTQAASDSMNNSFRRNRSEVTALERNFNGSISGAEKLNKSLDRLGNWRPRLTPPFIALIPIIGGVLGLLNPLVALLGAAGVAALGFGSNLGSIGGAAVAAIPGLAALLSMVFALKTAFGGIGSVFKAFGAQQKAAKAAKGGGGGAAATPAKAELSNLEQLQRAQETQRRAIEDVQQAQEDLNDTRAEAVRRLEDLRRAVMRAAAAEASARAGAQLARENYANVMADPGSTKGDKMAAAAQIQDADFEVEDTVQQNQDNAKALATAQKDGIDGDKQVIASQRRLTDAINAQRDAQLALINTQTGAGAGGAAGSLSALDTATNEYTDALNKLSPSAKAFVLALIAMQTRWELLQRTVQEAFFSEIIGQVGDLTKLFPVLTNLLSKAAGAAGRVSSRLIDMVTSAKFLNDIGVIADNNVPLIENVGDGLLYIIDGLKEVAIAAAPFAIALSEGFKAGADNFRNLVASARESGSLAAWLDTVLGRMQQWWRIVKNIGGTLFNYGAATSAFGQWLTNGFEKVTEGWLASSEAARQAGSPFQQYLEDVKPLLVEVKGLFADFFGWFGKTASDKKNIDAMTRIIAVIRDQLGPALGGIFDTLSKSGAGESLVKAIVAIVEALDTFLENGGIEGIKAFYETVVALADGFRDFVAVLPPEFISGLTTGFAVLAALRFTGITKLIGWLIKLGKSGGLLKVLDKMPLLGAGGGGGKHTGGTGLGGGGTPVVAGSTGRHAAPKVPGGKLGGIGKVAGALGKGGLVGAAASVAGGVAGGAISNSAAKGSAGAGQRIGGNAVSGAATGAGIGALIGSIIPVVGTAVGGVAGGAVGGAVGAATSSQDDIDAFDDGINQGLEDFFTDVGGMFSDMIGNISDWWNTEVIAPFQQVGEDIGKWWTENVTTPFNDTAMKIALWWNSQVVTPATAFVAAMGRGWDMLMVWWNETIIAPLAAFAVSVGAWWQENIAAPLNAFAVSVGAWWQENIAAPLNAFAVSVGTWWNDNISTPLGDFAQSVGTWWSENISGPLGTFAKGVGTWWATNISGPLGDFARTVGSWWQTNVATPIANFGKTLASEWKRIVTDPFDTAIKNIQKGWDKFVSFDVGKALTGVFNGWFKGGDASRSNKTGASTGGATLARVKSIMPAGLNVTSTYRTPAQNAAVGGVPNSYHTDKNNPAVDIAGSVSAMDRFAAVLRGMGGWRQLLYRVSGHYDHIHVAHQGGTVSNSWPRSPGDKPDERTTRLQVGEQVISKGQASLLGTGSIVPQLGALAPAGANGAQGISALGTVVNDNSMHFGDINVYNAVPEPASDSLPRTLRRAAYVGSRG
jgi:hypothetical protein